MVVCSMISREEGILEIFIQYYLDLSGRSILIGGEVFAGYQCHGYGGVVKHSHWLTASTYLIKYLSTNPLKIQEFKFN